MSNRSNSPLVRDEAAVDRVSDTAEANVTIPDETEPHLEVSPEKETAREDVGSCKEGEEHGGREKESSSSEDEDDEIPPVSPSVLEGKVKLTVMPGEERPKDNCPYCDTPEGDYNDIVMLYGDIQPSFIEDMMEHSWWRTGNVLYRPRQQSVCCPSYTMRANVNEFKFTKAHRKIMRKVAQFLAKGDPRWPPKPLEPVDEVGDDHLTPDNNIAENDSDGRNDNIPSNEISHLGNEESSHRGTKRSHPVSPGKGPDPAKKPCRKAKEIRKENRRAKGSPSKNQPVKGQQMGKSLREMVMEEQELIDPKHRLEVELHPVKPPSQKLEDTKQESYQLYERFQDKIHPGKIRFKDYSQFLWGFCDSCMTNVDDGEQLLGTFHQQYYLDGKLVAVSIIDILPHYFVSIYLYYDPDIRFIQPGIYTILRELDFVHELQKKQPSLCYYDLGYYNIWSPKVSYKGNFKPAQLLCPFTLHWCDLEAVKSKLQTPHVCALLSSEPRYTDGRNDDTRMSEAIHNSYIMFGSNVLKFSTLPRMFRDVFLDKMEVLYKQTGPEMMSKFVVIMTL